MLPTKFRFIWPSGFRGEELKKSANQKQESPVAAMRKPPGKFCPLSSTMYISKPFNKGR
jgi:hypothetical protein